MPRIQFAAKYALILFFILSTGCTSQSAASLVVVSTQLPATAVPPVGDAVRGEALFTTSTNGGPACSSCHTLMPGPFAVGPALKGVYERAATRIAGLTAEQYLRQSILDPKAFIVPGYRPIMYPDYAVHLSEANIADLIAYLSTR